MEWSQLKKEAMKPNYHMNGWYNNLSMKEK